MLSQVLELTSGPALVQSLGYTTPVNSVTAMRGSLPLAIQVADASVAAALPSGARLYYGVKLESALKGNWLALCELTASTDGNSPGLWTGTLLLNTPPMRTAMHADVSDPVAELTTLPCKAETYYTVPGQTDPVLSLNLDFVVNAPLYNGTEGIAPDPNDPYPSQSAVTAAVAKAATAIQPGKEDVYMFYSADPGAGDFQALGATACFVSADLAADTINSVPAVPGFLVVISGARGLTSLTCTSAGIKDLGTLPAGITHLDVSGNSLTTAAQDNILAQLVANGQHNGTLFISSQYGGIEPTAAGISSAATLTARGWAVYYAD